MGRCLAALPHCRFTNFLVLSQIGSLDRKCDIKKYFLHFCLFFLAYFSCFFSRIARYTPLEHIKNLLKNNKTNALKSKWPIWDYLFWLRNL